MADRRHRGAIAADLAATEAFGDALAGTDKPFVNTSGTLMLALAGLRAAPGTEEDRSPGGHRVDVGERDRWPSPIAASAPRSSASPRSSTATSTSTASARP